MPLYYFHIYQRGTLIRDEEGTLCAGLDEAKREAGASAADLARQAVARGEPVDELCVEIHDEQERVLAGLSIQEVLSNRTIPSSRPPAASPAAVPCTEKPVRIRKAVRHIVRRALPDKVCR